MTQFNMSINATNALSDINERLKNKEVDNNNLLAGHRINHKTDLEQLETSKVVFSEHAFKKIIDFMNKTITNDFTEFGTYFYGKVLNNILYIEGYLSDFEHSDGIYESGAVEVTDKNLEELDLMTEKTDENPNPFNIVMHFHTHPDHIKDKNGNIITPASLLYSENDLYSYAYQQKYLQPNSSNSVIFLGCLLPANNGNPQINCVYYDIIKENFVNIPNIYYMFKNEVHKFNNNKIDDNITISKEEAQKIKSKVKTYKESTIEKK